MNKSTDDCCIEECEGIFEMLDQLGNLLPDRSVEINDLLNNLSESTDTIKKNLQAKYE